MHSKEICKRRLTAKARETQSVILSPKDYYVVSLPKDSAKWAHLTKKYLVFRSRSVIEDRSSRLELTLK
jgi:hypothetical protein